MIVCKEEGQPVPVPSLAERYIIAARLKGYLDKHDESVSLLTEALTNDPNNVFLLRFRGHRRISIRDYHGAVQDLKRAAGLLGTVEDGYELYQLEVEKDAVSLLLNRAEEVREQHLPLSRVADGGSIYMSSLHTAVWYHLGVALYLQDKLVESLEPFQKAYESAFHPEGLIASLDWQYMIYKRLGEHDKADHVLEEYNSLKFSEEYSDPGYTNRMELYVGKLQAEDLLGRDGDDTLMIATHGYGVGNWYLYNGERKKAVDTFRKVLDSGAPHAFGYMAAENALRRLAA